MSDPRLAALPLDTVFHGRYRVLRAVRAGAMGAVYEVLDEVTNARRALKVMLPGVVSDPDLRARFALEARITGDVESDHIVRVSDAGIDQASDTPFLVMDLLRGEDLGSMIAAHGTIPPGDTITYLSQLALALDKTHAAGIIHRDLKPDNLFVTRRDDGSPCVKVLDFGIAKVVEHNQTHTTKPVGTPLYMSPEQIRGERKIGPSADIHAVGHIAYTLLVGAAYWDDERVADPTLFGMLNAIVAGPKEAPSARAKRRGVTLPEAFDAWFMKATAVDPAARFAEATEAVSALSAALGVSGTTGQAPPKSEVTARSRARAAVAASVTASGSAVAGAGAGAGSGTLSAAERSGKMSANARWILILAVAVGVACAAAAIVAGRDAPDRGSKPAATSP